MICRFFRSASSISSLACADVDVNGFSTKTCLPFSSACLRQVEVRPDRRDDRDGIDVGRFQHIGEVGRQLHAGYDFCARFSAFGFLSQTETTSHVFERAQVPDDVRTPVAVADNPDANGVGELLAARLRR